MKTKICAHCKVEHTTLYRIQVVKGKIWIFICETCCLAAKSSPHYRYGGTWQGISTLKPKKTIISAFSTKDAFNQRTCDSLPDRAPAFKTGYIGKIDEDGKFYD